MNVRDLVDQRSLVLHRGNAVEFRLERRNSLRVRRLLVHARSVEVADFLVDGIAPRAACRGLFENRLARSPGCSRRVRRNSATPAGRAGISEFLIQLPQAYW